LGAPGTGSVLIVAVNATSDLLAEVAPASFVRMTAPFMGTAGMGHVTAILGFLAPTVRSAAAQMNALAMASACMAGNATAKKASRASIAPIKFAWGGRAAMGHASWGNASVCQGFVDRHATLVSALTNAMAAGNAQMVCVSVKKATVEIHARHSYALRIATVTAHA